jgi:hypothetical protein
MLILTNTDNHVDSNDPVVRLAKPDLERSLERYASEITRVEVHFHDANANKSGANDKQCMLEVRLRGFDPMAITTTGPTLTAAYHGARDKLVRTLERRFSKRRETVRHNPFDSSENTR